MTERSGKVKAVERNFTLVGTPVRNSSLQRLVIGVEDVFVGGSEFDMLGSVGFGTANAAGLLGKVVTYDTVVIDGFNRLLYIVVD